MVVSASVNETIAKPPKKRGPGAPIGNQNRLQHGLYSPKAKSQTSEFGNRQTNQFRRHLVELVTVEHGEPSLLATALIQTATEATRAAIANREMLAKLIKSEKDVKPELKMQIDAQYLSHLDRRDKKLRELGLSIDQISNLAAPSSAEGQPRGLDAITFDSVACAAPATAADEPSEPHTPAKPAEPLAEPADAAAIAPFPPVATPVDPASDRGTEASGEPPGGDPPLLFPRW